MRRGTRKRYYTDNNEDALIMWTSDVTLPDYQTRLRQLRTLLAQRLRRQEQAADHGAGLEDWEMGDEQ